MLLRLLILTITCLFVCGGSCPAGYAGQCDDIFGSFLAVDGFTIQWLCDPSNFALSGNVTQINTANANQPWFIGTIQGVGASSGQYQITGGDFCAPVGRPRNGWLDLVCGDDGSSLVATAAEGPTCTYTFTLVSSDFCADSLGTCIQCSAGYASSPGTFVYEASTVLVA